MLPFRVPMLGHFPQRSRIFSRPVTLVMLALAAVCCGAKTPPERQPPQPTSSDPDWRQTEVTTSEVRLDEARPAHRRVGRARFRAGFSLRSNDPSFGGFSGLLVSGDQLLAVSDQGHWWRATLRHDESGRLVGLENSEMAPLADLDGRPVAGRMRRDAEELAGVEGRLLVTFEGAHRSHVYRRAADSRPTPGPVPGGIQQAPTNGGMEAVTHLPDGSLLIVAEDLLDEKGHLRAWLSDPARESWRVLAVDTDHEFKATAASTLPNGDVILLQRFWAAEQGVRVRLIRLAANELKQAAAAADDDAAKVVTGTELARLQPPLSVDNFEALDIGLGPEGQTYAYILADDNYSADQRTLLFQLELPVD